jgi:hypothetical protein
MSEKEVVFYQFLGGLVFGHFFTKEKNCELARFLSFSHNPHLKHQGEEVTFMYCSVGTFVQVSSGKGQTHHLKQILRQSQNMEMKPEP